MCIGHTAPADAACYDPREVIRQTKNPRNTTIMTVMHRGLWLSNDNRLPENSIGAALAADQTCIPGIELDVRLTKDRVPVLMHDATYGRLTDVFRQEPGNTGNPNKFYPDEPNPTGYNPKVVDLNWVDNDEKGNPATDKGARFLKLLDNPNSSNRSDTGNVTNYYVESVKTFYDQYLDNRMSTVVFFHIVDPAATEYVLQEIYKDQRDYNQGYGARLRAAEFTIIKFPAWSFPTPDEYRETLRKAKKAAGVDESAPDPLAYPYYGPQTLQELIDNTKNKTIGKITDPYTQSIELWIKAEDVRIGVELNVKDPAHLLQPEYERAKGKVALGSLHAVPDYPRVHPGTSPGYRIPHVKEGTKGQTIAAKDGFYIGSIGACCYELSDKLTGGDKIDRRLDVNFIVGTDKGKPTNTIITTDDEDAVAQAIAKTHGRSALWPYSPLLRTVLAFDYQMKPYHSIIRDNGKVVTATIGSTPLTWQTDSNSSSAAFSQFNGQGYLFFERAGSNYHELLFKNFNGSTMSDGEWALSPGQNLYSRGRPAIATSDGYLHYFGNNFNVLETLTLGRLGYWGQLSRGRTLGHGGLRAEVKPVQTGYKIGGSPAASAFGGSVVVLFKDFENRLLYSLYDGYQMRVPWAVKIGAKHAVAQLVRGTEFTSIPFNGRLFVFLSGFQFAEESIMCMTFNGTGWSELTWVPNTTSYGLPAVAIERSHIVLYTRSADGKNRLMHNSLSFPDGQAPSCNGEWSGNSEVPGPVLLHTAPVALQ
ncbi:hypothetical protein CU100_07195 [Phyllobacterium endophyticum]|uniref:GP-PDE domain-containing protein n=1 Tax=Phyllobacterium endophyticum TaxID=1149773 RepID=A0A2P7B1V9_9HYPH|nr:hypothetical protein CU100_07195 [Phyllobacterium endophyticum]